MTRRDRARVSVVVPFKGDGSAARSLLDSLDSIATLEGDELIAIDNTHDGTLAAFAAGRRVTVVHATDQASSYYARNVGAERARNPWILFTDADCRPHPSILDDYLGRALDERCGALGGEVVGEAGQDHVVARYARARRHLDQAGHMASSIRPFARPTWKCRRLRRSMRTSTRTAGPASRTGPSRPTCVSGDRWVARSCAASSTSGSSGGRSWSCCTDSRNERRA